MKKERIRIKGVGLGQVNVELIEAYKKEFEYSKLHLLAEKIIEENILGNPISTTEDIEEAERLVKSVYFDNIGEYVEDYMRHKLVYNGKDENGKRIISKLELFRGDGQIGNTIPKRFPYPFAERLQELRKLNGYLQAELADEITKKEQTAISSIFISALETGRKTPDINKLKAISDFFGVTCDYLIGISDEYSEITSNHSTATDVFSERITNARKMWGYTQKEVADKLNQFERCEKITDIKISMYENGKAIPNILRLIAIARLYETTLSYLLGQTNNIDK